jgi:hypothetical protein
MTSPEYVVIFTFSTQVTEDNYRIRSHYFKCTPETTLAEIFAWKKSLGSGLTPISLSIDPLESA